MVNYMKKFLKPISLLLVFILTFSMPISVSANDTIPKNDTATKIPFSELPQEYQKIISPDATIYQQPDGSYDIFQQTPILDSQVQRREPDDAFYAPAGGSYTDFENGQITAFTYVVYQTYLPRDNVDIYIAGQVPDIKDYIISSGAGLATSAIVDYIAKTWGYGFSASAVVQILNGAAFLLDWLNFSQVDTASNHGQNGILIEYLTNIGSGNSRVYSPWKNSYVPKYPYGGSAVWHPGDYYVQP